MTRASKLREQAPSLIHLRDPDDGARPRSGSESDAALDEIQLRLKSAPQNGTLPYLMFVGYHIKGMDNEAAKAYQRRSSPLAKRDSAAAVQSAFRRGSGSLQCGGVPGE
jgi:hypothetical protein